MTRKIYEYRFADGTIYETYFDKYELAAAVRKHGKLVHKKFLYTDKFWADERVIWPSYFFALNMNNM